MDVTLQERLEEATEDLGRCQTADEVAEILRRENVTGVPSSPCSCPLAVLVECRMDQPDGHVVEVDGESYVAYGLGETAVVAMSPAATAFVVAFDDHDHGYGDLAIPGSPCGDEDCRRCHAEVSG